MAQRTINTPREITHQRIADALEDMVDKMVDTSSASNIDYDNTQSGLSANKIQGAVDELASEKADKSTTLAGYGITDAYTKAEVYTQSEVNNIVSTLETNIDWKEAVNTYADIATTYPNPQDGWTVNVKDTDYTYRYNGSEWVAISANAIPEATTSVKGLMTPTQVSKLNGIEAGAQVNTVTSVAGKTGAVTLTKSDVGLGNVDNTSDLNKPISTAAQTALNSKVDKATGKGLSTNDYTNEEKQKNADNASAIEDIQEDISTSQTATGNPITIESSESNLVECVAEVEPIQEGSGDPSPTNIRPIIGQTEVVIEDCGKNLCYSQVNNTDIATLEAGTYTLSYEGNYAFNLDVMYDGDTSWTRIAAAQGVPYTFTLAKKGTINLNAFNNNISHIQVEHGSTATPYEPYKGKTYTIQLGDTIYGGELDVLTGKLRVTHEIENGGFTQINQNNGYKAYKRENMNYAKEQFGICNMISEYGSFSSGNMNKNIIQLPVSNQNCFVALDENYNINDVYFTYELATPYTIQLTPQQIRLLKGTNNISCNTGDLSIKYYPDNVLGQLKGDIEDEYDEKLSDLSNIEDTLNNKVDKAVVISEAIDLYTLTESGFYYIANVDQCTHKPNAYSALGSGTMIVARAGNRAMQILKAGNLLFETTIINLDTTPSATSWYRIPLQLRKQYDVTTDSNGIATLMTNFASNSVIPIHVFDTSGDIAIPYLNYNRNEVLCKFINPATMAPRSNASVLGDLIYQAYD